MDNIFAKIGQIISELSLVRKITMIAVLGVSFTVLLYLYNVSSKTSMEPLFTNLNSQDMGTILTRLDKQGVTYEVDQERRTINVPGGKVLELRVKLAEEGLPRFGGVGFELFDKTSFGMSDFEQKINYQRALEGELSRTISNIRNVESARIHLVLPEKSLFADSQQSTSASVILKMGNGGALGVTTVNAITHLVASSVEGLNSDQITVVDTQGRLLSSGSSDPGISAGNKAFDQKLSIEKSLEDRIVSLLTPVIGMGKVIVRASVDVDLTQTESVDEKVNPQETVVTRESRSTTKAKESATGSGGNAGASANLPGGAGGSGGSGGESNSDQNSEEINYAVSKTTRKQMVPMGKMNKLSLAILVDGTYDEKDGKKTYKPRTEEEITKVSELIKNAIGFSAERGDQLKVESMEFKPPEKEIAEAEGWFQQRTTYGFLNSIIGNVLAVVAFVLIFLFVIRPLMKSWQNNAAAGGANGLLPGQSGDFSQLVRNNPAAAVNAIRQWVK